MAYAIGSMGPGAITVQGDTLSWLMMACIMGRDLRYSTQLT